MKPQTAIPEQHLPMVYDRLGSVSLELRTVDAPELGPGEILVQMWATAFYLNNG